ncbi:PEP/pyruvate-binding domain-containing protein [Cellulomonas xiejunii]|uniref:PEP-utilizing enzyme n=1 Tax=Cellulomonas xiejunii TaxID=2968083 RepID=A0ABY5KR80_9CELL|nr:PEP/pyruvate-binding domain-containing protein [Cellulomonas xiejunii]MCC2322322.1 pyruvate, phosphate dikinase [Cellulomonas xiejunii]UUI72373.1 PEP-utilizing enzyme [Cellulomonas xiejunii]
MLIPLADATAATCGAKAGTLGRLVRARLTVPDGFVVPFAVHRAAPHGEPPDDLRDHLARSLATLGDVPVAVRSSAADEDGLHASAAGQHETVLAVQGADTVAAAVRTCWASLGSTRALAYRDATADGTAGKPTMGVLVQRLVEADVSGVMFTAPDAVTVIEASWGLGTSVVGGTVTPDTYRVATDGMVTCAVADKRTRVDRDGTRVVTRDVPEPDRTRPTLADDEARRLARLGRRITDVLGGAQDIEWAVAGGATWVLQARPVTAPPPGRPSGDEHGAPPAHGAPHVGPGTLVGTPGSRGTATGPARVVRGPGDFARVRPGDVLVCPWTDPAWTPLLRLAAGVVTETGGVLSHAAIVARERGIPAVLGVAGAMSTLADGVTLTVDGDGGTVTTSA